MFKRQKNKLAYIKSVTDTERVCWFDV